jgi:hypothetical protein
MFGTSVPGVGSSGSGGKLWQLSPTQVISSLGGSAGSAQLAAAGTIAIKANASKAPATVSLNRAITTVLRYAAQFFKKRLRTSYA